MNSAWKLESIVRSRLDTEVIFKIQFPKAQKQRWRFFSIKLLGKHDPNGQKVLKPENKYSSTQQHIPKGFFLCNQPVGFKSCSEDCLPQKACSGEWVWQVSTSKPKGENPFRSQKCSDPVPTLWLCITWGDMETDGRTEEKEEWKEDWWDEKLRQSESRSC